MERLLTLFQGQVDMMTTYLASARNILNPSEDDLSNLRRILGHLQSLQEDLEIMQEARLLDAQTPDKP